MINGLQLNAFPTSKSRQAAAAGEFINMIIDGQINPVNTAVQLKGIAEMATIALKDERLKDAVIRECDKYEKGETPTFQGAKLQVRETGTKWDYSRCGDSVYDGLAAEMAALKAKMDERERFLKSITAPMTIVDNETGEVYEVQPPKKTSTTSFSITFAK